MSDELAVPVADGGRRSALSSSGIGSMRAVALSKFDLMLSGCRLSSAAEIAVASKKPMIRTRSGVSGGLDLVLAPDIYVNCDVRESRVRRSSYFLDYVDEQFLMSHDVRGVLASIEVLPQPAYYQQRAADGTPMVKIGQMCSSDRICIGLTAGCSLWPAKMRCRFCSIGANAQREAKTKSVHSIVETVVAAAADPVLPARHVLLGGGTPSGSDRGALFAAEISRALKSACDLPIYAMVVPPDDLGLIGLLRESGVDEIGMNVELFDPVYLQKYAPGKHTLGHDHYYAALTRAVEVFGPVNTRSIAVVGLEPVNATMVGVKRLAGMGVMPILSPFRALDGSDLAGEKGLSAQECFDVFIRSRDICESNGLPLGPTCIPCQNNVLAMPFGAEYRYY